jgi:hypothetical protein
VLLRYWIGFTPQRGPKKPWYFAVISAIVMQSCRKRPPVSPSFPMFVPSQSWQMIGLYIQMAHKRERERSRSPTASSSTSLWFVWNTDRPISCCRAIIRLKIGAPAAARKRPFPFLLELSLCLSQPYLGKSSGYSIQWRTRGVFLTCCLEVGRLGLILQNVEQAAVWATCVVANRQCHTHLRSKP